VAELRDIADDRLAKYTDVAGRYPFATYDQTPIHDGPITAADVLMANLLSLRLDWRNVVPVFAEVEGERTPLRNALDAALEEARGLPALEECTEEQAAMPKLAHANWMAWEYPREGPKRAWTKVTVSKVLHRLAPNIPLVDSVVCRFYGVSGGVDFRQMLRNDLIANRDWLGELAQRYEVREQPMALTRVADIVIWMEKRA
jgi:hypothetical protein